MPLAF